MGKIQKYKPMWAMFAIILVLFCIGLICELFLKVWYYNIHLNPEKMGRTMRLVLQSFGNESLPLWTLPTLVLNWMLIQPKNVYLYAIRWLPYVVLLCMPILSTLMRKREIPLIVCAVIAFYEAVGILLTRMYAHIVVFTYVDLLPFLLEAILLLLAIIALGTKKKGFAITLGILFAIFAVLSPFITAMIAGIYPSMMIGDRVQRIPSQLWIQLRNMPITCAVSNWPIYKAFAFLMYALVMFGAVPRFSREKRK